MVIIVLRKGQRLENRHQRFFALISPTPGKVSSLNDTNRLCVLDIAGVHCAVSLDLSYLSSDLW